jgi:hypothetical protein
MDGGLIMGNVRLYGSTSGYTELAPPAIAPDGVLTLPSGTGTLATAAYVDAAVAAGGKVLQVVSATYSTQVSSSSNTYADTGLTATITPASTGSKILVVVMQSGLYKINNTSLFLRLMRDATQLIEFEQFAGDTNSATQSAVGGSGTVFLDSPASVAAVVYKTQFLSASNTASVRVQYSASGSTIALIEVKA